jgi:DNA-binding PadR family transcriptional regulator
MIPKAIIVQGGNMLKGEIEILAAIFLNRRSVKQITNGRLARHSPYFISSLGTLRQRGYILKHQTKGYLITDKGVRALAEYYPEYMTLNKAIYAKLLRKQASEVNKAIKMIENLSNEYKTKIDSMMDTSP